jgi:A/G-specific adenine glycosylase
MDLGAMVCRPKAPLCDRCPLAPECLARAGGAPETYPRRAKKADRPRRHGAVFVLVRGGEVALVRRISKGMLGGMLGLPTTDWRAKAWAEADALAVAPAPANWRRVGEIEHTFTHFSLTLEVYRAGGDATDEELVWLPIERALAETPSVFGKALRLAF